MNPNQPGYYPPLAPPPANNGGGLKIPILFGSVLALLGANVYLFMQLDRTKTDVKSLQASLRNEIQTVQQTAAVSTEAQRRRATELQDQLEAARRQSAMAVGQSKIDAEKRVEQLEKTMKTELKQETKAVSEALTGKIGEVRSETQAVSAKVGEVSTEVGAVKTDVDKTKTELEKTIGDLKRVKGDLGETSGLVATNGKELMALKALGERNYFEFRLPKAKLPQKVGDVMLTLKKSDQKKGRFTIELKADDKTVEKKDKTINEPLQFYVSKARQPYELVINEVGKDLIVGYLATPKVQSVRN